MNNYSDTKYYFYRTIFSLTEKDTLSLEKKTLLSHSKEMIPLIAFSPESKVIQEKLSMFARFLLTVELIAIVGFFVTLFRSPDSLSVINIPMTLAFICFLVFASALYYIAKTKNRLCVFYQTGQLAFAFSYRKNNHEQKKWADEFSLAIRNARLHFDQDNFVKISRGIHHLEKQNLINSHFAEELNDRLSTLTETNIK